MLHASFQQIVADPGRPRETVPPAVVPVSRVERSALVRASAQVMFDLVNDVESYAQRFAWCESAQVLQRGDDEMVARLQVRAGGMRTAFTTRNVLVPARSITLSLVEGPFSRFGGEWQFLALSEAACKVSLILDFDVAGRLVGGALASGFRGLADRLVDDFVREARLAHVG
jgi:ribosome-associated toxin RatA of RatAB toxin-antitoxin module